MFNRSILAAVLCVAALPAANASVTTYSTRADFNAAAPTQFTEGFEGITTPTSNGIGDVPEGTTFTRGSLTITDGGIAGAALTVLDNTYVNGANQIRNRFGMATGSVVDTAYGNLTLSFGGPVNAFAIDIASIARGFIGNSSATFTFQVDGVTIGNYAYSGSSGFGFYGFTDTTSFSSVTILNSAHAMDGVFDNVSFAAAPAAAAVPEPETLGLIGLGLVAVATTRFRRKR